MGTIVDARVPTSQFALGETLERVPDASFESVRIVAPGNGSVLPYLWAAASEFDDLEDALAADTSTVEATQLVRDDERALYQFKWASHVRVLINAILEEDGTLVDVRVGARTWKLRILFPDKDAMSSFYDFYQQHDIDVHISRVNGLTSVIERGGTQLSAEQYEALAEAFASDYYSVPRETTLVELAERLGVSHQAVSERLRRGHEAIIESSLHEGIATTQTIS